MNNTFFTSDLHLNHSKIMEYENRPFMSVDHMNATIIEQWNSVVKPKDKVYVLGDFVFGQPEPFLKLLNGYKILIKGNHDRYSDDKAIRMGFKEVYDLKTIKIDNKNITMCHYPMYSWYKSHYGSWHIHGHVHSMKIKFNKLRYNVGVDVNNFKPVSFDELSDIFEKQSKWNFSLVNFFKKVDMSLKI